MHFNIVIYLRCSLAGNNHAFQPRNLFTLFLGWQKACISTASFSYAVHWLAKARHFNRVIYLRCSLAGKNPGGIPESSKKTMFLEIVDFRHR